MYDYDRESKYISETSYNFEKKVNEHKHFPLPYEEQHKSFQLPL